MKPWQQRSLSAAIGVLPLMVGFGTLARAENYPYPSTVDVCDGGFDGQTGGQHSCQFPSGNRYQGPLENGKRQGWGIFTYRDGTRCEGTFQQDELTGRGACQFSNGDRYEGQFQKNLRQGPGIALYANGTKCEGRFVADVLTGFAACIYPSGNRYEGEFVAGVRQGWGSFSYGANGSKCSGPFVNDQLNGNGLCLLINGDRYEGSFANGQWQGQGTYTFADGQRQTTQWAMGRVATPIVQAKRLPKGKPTARRSRLARGNDLQGQ
jgi:hypothetical protein